MIQISIIRHNNEYSQIKAFGHAEYDDYGKDIICSAVSVLVINAANSLEKFTKDLVLAQTYEDGTTEILLKEHPSKEAVLLIDSLVLGLEGIRNQYGKKYLSVDYKEV
ncbi:MAG: ribosomal-processing cysteine protease Prp [Lachnospiraceae bacterium]|nr:ribosomal-processing cysteine protease Prp [Lachnospiraceae bacterium]